MSSSTNLKCVLEKFNSKLAYKQLDKAALDISRSLAAGNLGDADDNYAEWASVTNDPLVVVNLVKTYITVQVSKLSSSPFRPQSDDLFGLGLKGRLDSVFTEIYNDVLNDGYAFLAVGMENGIPKVKPVDARYILFNGDDPTLRDSTDVIVFEVIPLGLDKQDKDLLGRPSDLSAYVQYDSNSERVRVSHYHFDKKKNCYVLDFYDKDPDKPTAYPLKGLDRIPVIRFVGERIELTDKRYHYRGIYYQMGSVMKALALAGTKIQIRTASSHDSNFIVRSDAIANHQSTWKNTGTLEIDNIDSNGNEIPPVQELQHDNQFLIQSFDMWKTVIGDMLGPTTASGSEAVTREEVIARNEVKDAISNTYLSRMADSIEEVYRCIQMYTNGDTTKVIMLGGYIEAVKRRKEKEELASLYQLAKEGQMNTQGFVIQMLAISELPKDTKEQLAQSFDQDPFKSPQVIQLQQVVQKLNQTIQQQNTQIALLRLQATQRLERQKEFIDSTERTKRLEIALKQWTEEQKQTQEARMAVLNDCLAKGDYAGAIRTIEEIKTESTPIISDNIINEGANAFSDENAQSVQSALDETNQPLPNVTPMPGQQSTGFNQTVPHEQNVRQNSNVTAPAPRPAVTPFNDA